jgi:pyruvate dehydrogenase E2 component (dihydrolipoyllysine-residue acetyltransferase)
VESFFVSEFTLPELGENVTAGDVLRVLVKPGDTLAKDQPVLELETDKATIEVPSSVAGRVNTVSVKPGDKVNVGQVVLTVDDGADAGGSERQTSASAPAAPQASQTSSDTIPEGGLEQHVEGTKRTADVDKPGRTAKPDLPSTPENAGQDAGARPERPRPAAASRNVVDISRGSRPAPEPPPQRPQAPAAPSVRRMARELGVDVDTVAGTGAAGRISIDDVKAHAKRVVESARAGAGSGAAGTLPDFSRWGEIDRQPLRGVRKKTAEHVSAAWTTIPHVTQHDLADVTALEELRKKYAAQAEAAGGNLTVTAIAVKVVASALKVFPQFNASLDLEAGEIVYKKYVHIGLAVDTERGLLVPVIRDADVKNIIQIAVEIAELSSKAKAGKLSLDEMQGGCFSISNLGGIGGTYFTPIVNAPEVAILGISRARTEPVYRDGQLVPRLMLPLSLSYDHRVVDGADGIRFLRWVVQALEQPFLLALQG